jgi:MFS transporter, ACDE family, multidrug resistance protein
VATETERDEGVRPVYKDHNLHVLWSVTLMAVLGTSSVTPAFPTIVRELGISSGQVGLLITFFTLPGIVMTPLLGVLSDRYGRKKILVPALLLFGLAGGACAFARSFDVLLALRFFQGIGAAALGTLNVTVIGDIYDGRERSTALGYNSSVLSIGTASYPAIGGLLATFGWFYPFALPFAAIPIAIVVMFSLHNPEPRNDDRLRDYFGSVWENLHDREVFGLIAASLLTYIVLFGPQISYLPILMNARFDAPSYVIGAVLSGASLTTVLTSTQLGRLTSRFSEKSLLKTAFVLYAIALIVVAFAPSLPFSCSPPSCSEWRKGSTSPTSSRSSTPTPPQRTAGRSWPRTVCPSVPARR